MKVCLHLPKLTALVRKSQQQRWICCGRSLQLSRILSPSWFGPLLWFIMETWLLWSIKVFDLPKFKVFMTWSKPHTVAWSLQDPYPSEVHQSRWHRRRCAEWWLMQCDRLPSPMEAASHEHTHFAPRHDPAHGGWLGCYPAEVSETMECEGFGILFDLGQSYSNL